MRIALATGMNRETPPGVLSRSECEHRRRLWWTLYIIDRKLSINMGAPLSITDKDIDISLPSHDDLRFSNTGLCIHAKLAVLEGKVMSGKFLRQPPFLTRSPTDSSKLPLESTVYWTALIWLPSVKSFRQCRELLKTSWATMPWTSVPVELLGSVRLCR